MQMFYKSSTGVFSKFPFFVLYAEVASPQKFWEKCNTHRFYRTSPSLKIVNLTFYLKIIPTESSRIPSSFLSGMICLCHAEPPTAQKKSTEIIINYIPVVPHKAAAEVSKIGNLQEKPLMVERSLWWTDRWLRSPLFLSFFLSFSLYISLPLSLSLSLSLPPSLPPSLALSLSLSLSFPLFLWLPT